MNVSFLPAAVGRKPVLVNGNYVATKCNANQESLAEFGVVPKAVDRAHGLRCGCVAFAGIGEWQQYGSPVNGPPRIVRDLQLRAHGDK